MMIRNCAKQPLGLFTRTAAKVAALTVLQYVNYVNHRQIGQASKTTGLSAGHSVYVLVC